MATLFSGLESPSIALKRSLDPERVTVRVVGMAEKEEKLHKLYGIMCPEVYVMCPIMVS